MLWSKLKNLILAILLLVNGFLLVLVLGEAVEEDSIEQESRNRAMSFLQERGVGIEEGIAPREIRLDLQQLVWNREQEETQANLLLGAVEKESIGAEVVRYYNESGEIRFHGNGEFYASFSPGTFSGQDREAVCEKVLEALGISARYLSQQRDVLVYLQEAQGVGLLGCEIWFLFQGEDLMEIPLGRRLEGEYSQRAQEEYTVSTVLMQFYQGMLEFGQDCTEISEMELCYLMTTPLTSPVLLVPGCIFRTDVGEYVLDLTTGILIKGNL